jgi:hypothetical protein
VKTAGDPCNLNDSVTIERDSPDTKIEEPNVSISLTTIVLQAKLLEEEVVPMCPCEDAGPLDDLPVVLGYADDEDEEDEEDDVDDLDEDEDQEGEDDEELDEEGLGYEWEEVTDDEDDEDDEDDDE